MKQRKCMNCATPFTPDRMGQKACSPRCAYQSVEKAGIKTGQEREAYAYAHDDYIAILTALQYAVEKEEYLKLMIAGCNSRIDLYRTEQANERNERKAYGA